jgi:hypothetical protein
MTHPIVLTVVVLGWLALWILAVASILRRPEVRDFERGVWIAIVVIFPFVGPLVWAAVGRNLHRTRPARG